jgi:hypothetical protein
LQTWWQIWNLCNLYQWIISQLYSPWIKS